MKLSKATLITLRSAAIMFVKAIDAALLELYGWTPRTHTPDLDVACYTESGRSHT